MRSTERSPLIMQQVIDSTDVDNRPIGLTFVLLSVILFLPTESERCSGSGSVKLLDSGIRVRDEKTGSVML